MNLRNKIVIASLVGLSVFAVSAFAQAQSPQGLDCSASGNGTCTYTPLEPLPSILGFNETNFPSNDGGKALVNYINLIFILLIIIGAMIAVVKFSIGGIMYMVSEITDTKSKARQQMWSSIWGLLLLISSVLILQTINPNLVNLNFFQTLTCLSQGGQTGSSGACATVSIGNMTITPGGSTSGTGSTNSTPGTGGGTGTNNNTNCGPGGTPSSNGGCDYGGGGTPATQPGTAPNGGSSIPPVPTPKPPDGGTNCSQNEGGCVNSTPNNNNGGTNCSQNEGGCVNPTNSNTTVDSNSPPSDNTSGTQDTGGADILTQFTPQF